MNIKVMWDNSAQTILRYEYTGNWSVEDYQAAIATGHDMVASVSHPVCVYNDFQQTSNVPDDFVAYAKITYDNQPENVGLCLFITTKLYFETLYRILSELMPEVPNDEILVTSEAEAYRRLDTWLAEQMTI